MEEKQVRKITLGFVLGWIFGVIFLLSGVVSLLTGMIIEGLLSLVLAIILLPPANNFIAERFNFVISRGLKIVLVLVLLVVIGIVAGGKTDEDVKTNDTTKIEETADTEEVEEEVEVVQDWVKVTSITASASKQSDTFELKGGKQKIVYSLSGGNYAMCSIYLEKEGTDIAEVGGFPIVIITEAKSDETMTRKSSGNYYLQLSVANGTCVVDVYEYR